MGSSVIGRPDTGPATAAQRSAGPNAGPDTVGIGRIATGPAIAAATPRPGTRRRKGATPAGRAGSTKRHAGRADGGGKRPRCERRRGSLLGLTAFANKPRPSLGRHAHDVSHTRSRRPHPCGGDSVVHHGTIQSASGLGGHYARLGALLYPRLRARLSLAQAVKVYPTPPRVMDMTAFRSSTGHPEPRPTAAAKRARSSSKSATAAKTSIEAAPSARRTSRAAELLREIEIDGEALSVQIERLRRRFL